VNSTEIKLIKEVLGIKKNQLRKKYAPYVTLESAPPEIAAASKLVEDWQTQQRENRCEIERQIEELIAMAHLRMISFGSESLEKLMESLDKWKPF
jgi:hypothetical protein